MEYLCKFCPKMAFKADGPLKSHLQRIHFYCGRCDKKCDSMQDFLLHCKQDHKFNHHCQKCSMKFLSAKELEQHDQANHASLKCPDCPHQAKSKETLRVHMITHSKNRRKFVCSHEGCGKEFLWKHGLKGHIETSHTDSSAFLKCDFCSYVAVASRMKRHLKRFCGPDKKMILCDICNLYKVPNAKLLNIHKAKEHQMPNMSIKCEFCSYRSSNKDRMKRHQDLCGPDVTMVKCHKCEYQVPTDTLLRAHIVNRHRSKLTQRQRDKRLQRKSLPPGEFICPTCGHTEQYEHTLQIHMDRRHGQKRKCEFCDYETKFKHRMEFHLERCGQDANFTHCTLCTFKCSDKGIFGNHLKTKHKIGPSNKKQVLDKGPQIKCQHCDYQSYEHNMERHAQKCGPNVEFFFCTECQFKVPTPTLLRRHMNALHPGAPMKQCDKCRYQTFTDSLLKHHSDNVHVSLMNCTFCDFQTKVNEQMEEHTLKCGPDAEMYACDKCQKFKVSCKATFDLHTCKDISELLGRKKCSFCDYSTRDSSRLAAHAEKCGENVQMLQCDECDFVFNSRFSLNRHKNKLHPLTKCKYCNYENSDSSKLRAHVAKCSEEICTFQCNECPFKYNSHYQLNVHKMKVHGTKHVVSYNCEHCDYVAQTQESLRKHQKICGPDTTKFQCQSCPSKFGTMYYLTIHIGKTHGRKKKCDFCDFECNEPARMKAHMEKCFISDESFVCDLCGKEFQSQFVLKGHKKTHTNSKKRKAQEMLDTEEESNHSSSYLDDPDSEGLRENVQQPIITSTSTVSSNPKVIELGSSSSASTSLSSQPDQSDQPTQHHQPMERLENGPPENVQSPDTQNDLFIDDVREPEEAETPSETPDEKMESKEFVGAILNENKQQPHEPSNDQDNDSDIEIIEEVEVKPKVGGLPKITSTSTVSSNPKVIELGSQRPSSSSASTSLSSQPEQSDQPTQHHQPMERLENGQPENVQSLGTQNDLFINDDRDPEEAETPSETTDEKMDSKEFVGAILNKNKQQPPEPSNDQDNDSDIEIIEEVEVKPKVEGLPIITSTSSVSSNPKVEDANAETMDDKMESKGFVGAILKVYYCNFCDTPFQTQAFVIDHLKNYHKLPKNYAKHMSVKNL